MQEVDLKTVFATRNGRTVADTEGQATAFFKLPTPFGGGKSHTLAALLHGARSRAALDALPEADRAAPPGAGAVVDGQFFDAQVGKRVPQEGFAAKTVWGWIAWALAGREVAQSPAWEATGE